MTIVAELERILEKEQRLLLTGDYGQLAQLAEEKNDLAERLADGLQDLSVETVEKLAEQAGHNEALLKSARRGMQAAMTQLKQFSEGEHQSTYSAEGRREPLSRPVSVTQKL